MLPSAHLLTPHARTHVIRGLLYLKWEQGEGRMKKKRMQGGRER